MAPVPSPWRLKVPSAVPFGGLMAADLANAGNSSAVDGAILAERIEFDRLMDDLRRVAGGKMDLAVARIDTLLLGA